MDTEDREATGKRIRMARMAQRLSLESLARKAGVSPSHIHEIEEGLTVPELETLIKICNALGLWPDYALGRSKINVYNGAKTLN